MKLLGVVLIILGALGLYFRAIPYTKRETLDVGPFHAGADVHHEYPVPPWASVAAMGVGIGLLWMPTGRKSRRR